MKKNIFIIVVLLIIISIWLVPSLSSFLAVSLLWAYLLSYIYEFDHKQTKDTITNIDNIESELSPALINIFHKLNYDARTFFISLMNMYLKGHISFELDENILKKGCYVTKNQSLENDNVFHKDEKVIFDTLKEKQDINKLIEISIEHKNYCLKKTKEYVSIKGFNNIKSKVPSLT